MDHVTIICLKSHDNHMMSRRLVFFILFSLDGECSQKDAFFGVENVSLAWMKD